LFDAKKRPAAPLSTRQRWFYIGGVLVLGILSAGGWFWWQSRAVGGNTLLAPNTQPPTFAASPTLPASEPEKAPAPVDPRAATPAADANKPPATTPTTPSSPAPATAQEHAEAPLDIGKPAVTNHPPVEPKPGDRAKVIEVPANVAASDVHFVRDSATASVPTTVANAYQAFQRGDYATALMQYRHYLDIDPRSRDALLGIGAAAVRLGQMDEARQAYRTALAVDPKDAVASAALASLANDGDIEGSEGKLRQIYDAQPTPAAASALGGLLSRQGRWREAQDYYFRAYNAAPNDPDNAFNLAVSLDALGERKLAAEYYGKALGLSGGSFDRSAAKRRLDSLNTR
jgi:Flp pilus assembly protein TadD